MLSLCRVAPSLLLLCWLLTGQVIPVACAEEGPSAAALVEVLSGAADTPPEATPLVEEPPSSSLASPGSDLPVSLQADTLDYHQDDQSYAARGDVRLSRGQTVVTADQLFWQATTQDAVAEGAVTLTDPEGRMTGSSLRYNLATGEGRLSQGQVFLTRGNFHLAGDAIEQVGTASYRIADGSFTTCDGEVPDWKFTAGQVTVDLGEYATARHVWFHVRDIPLLYTPYLVFPVKSERESGLLTPRIGQSREQGTILSQAWYQVIDRHMDATVQLDYMSEIGLGKGLEYRYLFGRDNLGEARYYHVGGASSHPDMYALDWLHGGTLPGGVWLSADIQQVNNRDFFETFGRFAEEYNQDKTVSQVWLQRNWHKFNTVLRGRYIKDLEDSNAETLQRLPELGVSLSPYRLGTTPLFARLESYVTHFARDEGEEGRRLYLRPALTATFKLGPWLEFVPEVALHQRVYDTNARQEEQSLPEFAATLGTRLHRVYSPQAKFAARILHSVEPAVTYRYLPDTSEEDLPVFDSRDRLAPQNRLEYAVVNRLTLRSDGPGGIPAYRDFMSLRLSQSYDIGESQHASAEERRPFSDLRVEYDLLPTSSSFINLDSRITMHGPLQFSRASAEAGYRDTEGNRVALGYVYRDSEDPVLRSEYFRMTLETALLRPIYLHFEERFSVDGRQELEKVAEVEYRAQCWSIFLSYRDRLQDEAVFISFALAGLGRTAGFGGKVEGEQGY